MPNSTSLRSPRLWPLWEQLNFVLTNRIPRRLATQLMGWYSRIESPLLTRLSIAVWRWFDSELDFTEARKQDFRSVHECFTRELKEGMRPIDPRPDVVISPCDAIIGACGRIDGERLFQAKGFPYELGELIPDPRIRVKYSHGVFVTLRLKSSMYHRFHAPIDSRVDEILYISGDTWNVNPPALRRIDKLFCQNERAVVELHPDPAPDPAGRAAFPTRSIVMVPVAAILVASMKFHCLPEPLDLRHRGPNRLLCAASYRRGEEMGYFQNGSTIIVFASAGYRLAGGVETGERIAMGRALLVEGA